MPKIEIEFVEMNIVKFSCDGCVRFYYNEKPLGDLLNDFIVEWEECEDFVKEARWELETVY